MNKQEPDFWQLATIQLTEADEVMAMLIKRHPQVYLTSRGDAFETLARAITGQQISVKAAETVWQRLLLLTPVTPAALVTRSVAELRACGYSQRKVDYLQDLARHFNEELIDPNAWPQMADADIIRELTQIRGIGQWSAEMFLMFNLLRPDILPVDDIGLQKAFALHYPDVQPQNRIRLRQYATRWQPWRSVATWYLWRSLDPVAVEY